MWTAGYVFSLSALSANDVVLDSVINFRLAVDGGQNASAHRDAFVYVGYMINETSTRRNMRRRFTAQRNPLPEHLCLRVRVADDVGRVRRAGGDRLTTFVSLSAAVGGQRRRRQHRRRNGQVAQVLGVSVATIPYLTIRVPCGDVSIPQIPSG